MDKFISALKDWLEVIGVLGAWVLALWAWFSRQAKRRSKEIEGRLKSQIDGVGAKVSGLEVAVGQHETRLDRVDREIEIASSDRRQMTEKIGEFKAEVANLTESCERRDKEHNKLLTDIQVGIGKLETKVDILLQDRNHD